jgi:3-deoxy-D-manno-octulosonic-acid transferase
MSSQVAIEGRQALPWTLHIYRAVMSLARPALWLLLRRRAENGKEDRTRQGERYGIAGIPRPAGDVLWMHAASVGETNAVLPLIERLLAARKNLTILLTTGTVTSAGLAAKRLPARALHQYLPLDSTSYVRRFLNHWRPTIAILTEQEIWPNLILEAHARGIRIALINARMSKRSLARWQSKPESAKALFGRMDAILAQNDQLAQALTALGATNTSALGNLKLDAPLLPIDKAAATALRAALANRPSFLAASTHPGEDAIVADAHCLLRQSLPNLCTIIVPRHPHRGVEIAADLTARGLAVAVRSQGQLPGPGIDIYLADTIGELGTFYSVSGIAFIGGSLVEKGGQNPIEAVRHGASVLVGPWRSSFDDIYDPLLAAGGAVEVQGAEDMAQHVLAWLQTPASRDAVLAKATAALDRMAGGLDRTAEAIIGLLDHPTSSSARR